VSGRCDGEKLAYFTHDVLTVREIASKRDADNGLSKQLFGRQTILV
jgi:hypothetical protein